MSTSRTLIMSNVGTFSRFALPMIRTSTSYRDGEDIGYFRLKIGGLSGKCRIAVALLEKHDYSNPDNDVIVEAYHGAWFWDVNISRGCVKSIWMIYRGPRKVLSVGEKRELVAGCRKVLRKLGRGDT